MLTLSAAEIVTREKNVANRKKAQIPIINQLEKAKNGKFQRDDLRNKIIESLKNVKTFTEIYEHAWLQTNFWDKVRPSVLINSGKWMRTLQGNDLEVEILCKEKAKELFNAAVNEITNENSSLAYVGWLIRVGPLSETAFKAFRNRCLFEISKSSNKEEVAEIIAELERCGLCKSADDENSACYLNIDYLDYVLPKQYIPLSGQHHKTMRIAIRDKDIRQAIFEKYNQMLRIELESCNTQLEREKILKQYPLFRKFTNRLSEAAPIIINTSKTH